MVDTVIFFGTKANNVVVAGLLSVAAGLFVGAVGAQSHRRFTVWFGAFGATVGAVILATKIADSATDSGSNSHAGSVFGVFLLLFGAAMVGVAALAARALREPTTGDQPAVPEVEAAPPL
jgi:drug/metabolite transporter (DMT)-like permease